MTPEDKKEGFVMPVPEPYVTLPEGTRDKDFIVITIGSTKKCLNRYEITKSVPNVEKLTLAELAVATAEDGIELQAVINAAYRQIFGYRPPFQLDFDRSGSGTTAPDPRDAASPKFVDFPLGPNGHEGLQKTCDSYKPGSRTTAPGQRVKAAKMDSIETALKAKSAELGKEVTIEDLMKQIAKLKK